MPVAASTATSLREIENPHVSERDWRSLQDKDMNSGNGANRANSRDPEKTGSTNAEGSGENEKVRSSVSALPSAPVPAPRKEVSVTAGSAWKTAFTKFLPNRGSEEDDMGIDWNDPMDPTRMINSYGQDLCALWADIGVRALLRAQKLRLEELPGL